MYGTQTVALLQRPLRCSILYVCQRPTSARVAIAKGNIAQERERRCLFHRWTERYWCERSATCTLGQLVEMRCRTLGAQSAEQARRMERSCDAGEQSGWRKRVNVRDRSPEREGSALRARSGRNQRGETHILNPSALKQPIFLTFSLPHTLFSPLASSLANFISLYKSLLANRKLFQLWSQCLNKQIVSERIRKKYIFYFFHWLELDKHKKRKTGTECFTVSVLRFSRALSVRFFEVISRFYYRAVNCSLCCEYEC